MNSAHSTFEPRADDYISELPQHLKGAFPEYFSGYLFEIFLYGVNTLLFFTSVIVLLSRGSGLPLRALLASALTIFIVSTSSITLSAYCLFQEMIPGGSPSMSLLQAKQSLALANNIIADATLIFRCYAVWSRSKYAIAAPCVLLLATTIYGVIYIPGWIQELSRDREYWFLWLTLATNITVTSLIVLRIWWMARQVRNLLGRSFARKHYSGIAIIIEAGAIYSVYILVYQILKKLGIHCFLLDIAWSQISVIAPMLIIVQLGLGRHIRDVEATLRLRNAPSTIVLSTVHSIT